MKRQIVLEDDQLIKMVNESAKRVLRSLMTEAWYDNVPILGDVINAITPVASNAGGNNNNSNNSFDSSDLDDIYDLVKDNPNQGILRMVGADSLKKLYQANKDAFTAIVNDPMMLSQLAGNPTMVDQMAENPSFMTRLATNPNVKNAFCVYGPQAAMNFFSDQNLVQMMQNPNIDMQTRQLMFNMINLI